MDDGTASTQYYYNLTTGQVETVTEKGQSKDLLGPYHSHEAAAAALRTAQERTKSWDEGERRWRDGDDD